MVKILSWNTLESGEGGAWSNGWGCPLEIRRREELAKTIFDNGDNGGGGGGGGFDAARSEAERMLADERYQRIRTAVLNDLLLRDNQDDSSSDNTPIDFLLFQECTVGDFWDVIPSTMGGPPGDATTHDSRDETFFSTLASSYEKVPCPPQGDDDEAPETLQHVYVRRDSGWRLSSSVRLRSASLVGGCLAEFVGCGTTTSSNNKNNNNNNSNSNSNSNEGGCAEQEITSTTNTPATRPPPSLVLVNLHGKSGTMRDPDLRRAGVLDLWKEIGDRLDNINSSSSSNKSGGDASSAAVSASWRSRIVLCGDWNTHLEDLVEPFREAASAAHNNGDTEIEPDLWPVVGLLHNTTATGYPRFSTNHEEGFLGQYDGCLWFGTPPSSSSSFLELEEVSWNLTGFMPKGTDGKLSGDQPPGTAIYNNFTYHDGSLVGSGDEGVYLNGIFLPGSDPSMGLSDHLRIYTTLGLQTENGTSNHSGDTNDSENGNENGNDNVNDNVNNGGELQDHPQRRPYRWYNRTDEDDNGSFHRREEDANPEPGPRRGLRG